jgi:hypothetical protein
MDEIDGGYSGLAKEAIAEHIKECPDCRAFSEVSENLKSFGKIVNEIDLWNDFIQRLENRNKRPAWLAPAFAALAICLIVAFFSVFNDISRNAVKNIDNSGGSVHSEVIDSESSDDANLNYCVEISMDM